jgi:tetratricopeptide (TPR) repeat protein
MPPRLPRCRVVLATTMALAVASLSGCAARQRAQWLDGTAPVTDAGVRRATIAPRIVTARTDAKALEQSDGELAAALRRLEAQPSSRCHQTVAAAYARLGVADAAIDHFDRALRLDRGDSVSYEGRARVWRDLGMVTLALGDAHRAVYYAPRSGPARNTLGTVFQLMGRVADARRAYEKALAFDPAAAYALSNLCYITFVDGDALRAEGLCRRALAVQADLVEARRNLAIVVARDAAVDDIRAVLEPGAGGADVEYSLGIALFANRRFAESADAFERAATIDPSMRHARDTARHVRTMAVGTPNPGDPR